MASEPIDQEVGPETRERESGQDRFGDVRQRILAAVIDNTFLVLLLVINLTLVSEFAGSSGLIAIAFVSVIAIPAGMTAVLGWTPGKRMMGLRITTIDSRTTPPGWVPGALRSIPLLIRWVPIVNLVVACFNAYLINSDPERRSIFDRLAQTRVVRASHL